MEIEFDPDKNLKNIQKHELDFNDVPNLDWQYAMIEQDMRKDYGENRFYALMPGVDCKLYSVTFTMRGSKMRIISYRRARDRERKRYER